MILKKVWNGVKWHFCGCISLFLVSYKHVEEIGYDFVVLNNGKRIPISEDRRKIISGQYCEMEDTFYVDV